MSFYSTVITIFKPIIKTLFRVSVTGEQKLPDQKGGYLICANHTSMMDAPVILVAIPRRIDFMAKKEIFKVPLVGSFLKAMGAFPVDRGGSDVGAIKKTVSILSEGGIVSLFPQGTRRKYVDPSTTEVKSGVGMIAYRSGCDVLPIFIRSKNNHLHIFGKNQIIVGDIIKNEELGFDKGGKAEYERAAKTVFERICALGGYGSPSEAESAEKE